MINMILAIDCGWAIGHDDMLLYSCKEDMERFVTLTKNNVVVMGSNTANSLPKSYLKDRVNYIVSRNFQEIDYSPDDNTEVSIRNDLTVAIVEAGLTYPNKEIFIIGGASIYEQCVDVVDRVFLTIYNTETPKANKSVISLFGPLFYKFKCEDTELNMFDVTNNMTKETKNISVSFLTLTNTNK